MFGYPLLVFGEYEKDAFGVGGEGGEDVEDGGQLEAATSPNHHALPGRLLAVRQEGRTVEPDEVQSKHLNQSPKEIYIAQPAESLPQSPKSIGI